MESVKIKLITYNVGDKSSDANKPDGLFDFAHLKEFDFIFIGLQEVVDDSSWTGLIKKSFGEHDYVLLKIRNIWAIWLYSLVKRSLLPELDNVESEVKASGYGGVMGNKGGVTIRFQYKGISLAVVSAHFTAHEDSFKERLNDYLDIVTGNSFRDPEVVTVLDHDIVFWMGDLNFRIDSLEKENIEKLIKDKNYSEIVKHDQLKKAIAHHNVFRDFKEGDLTFPPTYKFDEGSDTYDTSKKKRKPAWTDRILHMTHNDDQFSNISVEILKYYSEPRILGSDHRPVCSEFSLSFNSQNHHHLPIEFLDVSKGWRHDHDHQVDYRWRQEHMNSNLFKPDRWDWIALVPANWTILADDLITYVYATCTCERELCSRTSIEFSKKHFHSIDPKTQLQLVYFSKRKNCIQGISSLFSLQ